MMKSRKKKPVDPDPAAYQGHQLILAKDLEVKGDLGEGQYGVVQLGLWNRQTDVKFVAIKSLKNADFDGVLKSFLEEAQTMQKLSHSNIVQMYGISLPFKDEPLKLVTEFASYGSLEKNLQEKNSDVCRVSTLCKFAVQVAEGMNYLASENYVHRDLAARNILVFQPDLVKISDFGLARTLEGRSAKKISANRKLAVAWLPPEAIRDNVFTPRSDVWSYGVTLWEMFSFGEKPWEHHPLQKIKQMIVNDQPTNRLRKPDACPDGFYEIMLSCWECDPEKRPKFGHISSKISELQPKEGITRVEHNTIEQGHLSYDWKVKVSVISKREDDMLLVQSENGSIGLVNELNLDFSKKALQKRAWSFSSGANPGHISGPYDIKKETSKELLRKLQMIGTNPGHISRPYDIKKPISKGLSTKLQTNNVPPSATANIGVVEEEVGDLIDLRDTTSDFSKPLSPANYAGNPATGHEQMPQVATSNQNDEQVKQATTGHQTSEQQVPPGTTRNQITPQNPAEFENYYMSKERNAAVNDGDDATLKDIAELQHLMKHLDPQMLPRTESESDTERLRSDTRYAVPRQHKDDTSLGLGSKETPGGSKSPSVLSSTKCLVDITTTASKRKPVPFPRKPRRLDAGSLDTKTVSGKELSPGNGNFLTLSDSQGIANSDAQGVAGASADKKVTPPVPLPYQPAKCFPEGQELGERKPDRSEMSADERAGDNKHVPVDVKDQPSLADSTSEQQRKDKLCMSSESQALLPPVGQNPGVTNNTDLSQLREHHHYENVDERKELKDDLTVLSSNPKDGVAKPGPIYDIPIKLPEPPHIPPEVLNQPPPLPEKHFGGTFGRRLVSNNKPQVGPVGVRVFNPALESVNPAFQPVNPAFQSVNPAFQPVNPAFQPVNPAFQTVNPAFQTVNPSSQPVNPAFQPVNPVFQPVNPSSQPVNPAFQPVNPALQPVNPVFQPVNPVFQTVNPSSQPVNPAFQPVNPVFQRVNPSSQPVNLAFQPANTASQPVNPGGSTNEGAYGEDIVAKIRKIRQICGEVPHDWCHAALLQFQGDIEQVVGMFKIQKLSKLTGKTEQFCERTLSHCSWDLDRAAIYIFENFGEKDV